MTLALEIIAWACLLSGSFFLLVGGIGVLRMPDFFTRGHAAGITDTMGAGLVLAGMMIEAGWSLNLAKLALILFFLLFTSPTSSHAVAHAALLSGLVPWTKRDRRDDRAPSESRAVETAPQGEKKANNKAKRKGRSKAELEPSKV